MEYEDIKPAYDSYINGQRNQMVDQIREIGVGQFIDSLNECTFEGLIDPQEAFAMCSAFISLNEGILQKAGE